MTLKNRILREICEWIVIFAAAFLLVMLLNTAVFATTQVKQTSMENTLMEDQHLFIEKLTYLFKKPAFGDIIVFIEEEYPTGYFDRIKIFLTDVSEIFRPVESKTNKRLVKRIIGVPGDKIDIRNGKVYINGKMLNEPYIKGETVCRELQLPLTVPPEKYFVLGDNREVSKDSRNFGLIDSSQIEGKVVFRFWPLKRFGLV